MDQFLNGAPAFAYIKQLSLCVVINNESKPIAVTDDPDEVNWLFNWVVDYEQHQLKPADRRRRRAAAEQKGERVIAKAQPVLAARNGTTDRRLARPNRSSRRQLIGEQVGPKRVIELRLFRTQEEVEKREPERPSAGGFGSPGLAAADRSRS